MKSYECLTYFSLWCCRNIFCNLVIVCFAIQNNDGKGKADFELEERGLSRSQDGKDSELRNKDPFDAVDDFKPIGVPWGGKSRDRKVFLGNTFLRNFAKFTRKHLHWKLFLSILLQMVTPKDNNQILIYFR